MSRGIERAFAEWRFLSLTLLICAYLLAAPLIVAKWPVQMLLELLLLVTVLVTMSANPGWQRLRRALVVLWLMSVAGTLLSVFSVRPDLRPWYRTVELLTSVPVLAVLAAGMLAFVRRERRLTARQHLRHRGGLPAAGAAVRADLPVPAHLEPGQLHAALRCRRAARPICCSPT